MKYYLGLSFGYHDSAAAIVGDGELIVASEEERFSRKKNDNSFPFRAIQFCLEQVKISPSQLDGVVYYENWKEKLDRIIKSGFVDYPHGEDFLGKSLSIWIKDKKFDPIETISHHLKIPTKKIQSTQHHRSHAAASYYTSPFEDAAVVTIDGVGEYECLTISTGKKHSLKKRVSQCLPHSLGLFYSAFTSYLGFKVNEDEYKVMGMAGYGKPTYVESIRKMIHFEERGMFSINMLYFNFLTPLSNSFNSNLTDLLGASRSPEEKLNPESINTKNAQRFVDIAHSLQVVTEETILHIARNALKISKSKNLCLGGGVALNSLANGRIQRELDCQLYIHPAAGDAGTAAGAALAIAYRKKQPTSRAHLNRSPYLGKSYSSKTIIATLEEANHCEYEIIDDEEELLQQVAAQILQNKVIGWFQGRFEWGPRALGNRSILANPTAPDMQDIINRKIKFREPFRPFAPVVLPHKASEYFEIPDNIPLWAPESYMLSINKVREPFQKILPAITHTDGTARVQLARKEWNPKLYRLLEIVGSLNKIPMLLNTSFNLKGEPIVNTPQNALMTFSWSDMDLLILENAIIRKRL